MARSIALVGLVATLVNADADSGNVVSAPPAPYQPSGLTYSSGMTAMNIASNWYMASPFASADADKPSETSIGITSTTVVTQVQAGDNIDVGSKIVLNGNVAIQMGGSTTNPAVISFGSPTMGTRTSAAMFGPPADATNPIAPMFDFNCNLNYMRTTGEIPSVAPCGLTAVTMSATNSQFANTYGNTGSAMSFGTASTPSVNACNGPSFMVGPVSSVSLGGCGSTFAFGTGPCSTAGVAAACAISGIQYGVVEGQISEASADWAGTNVSIVTNGPFAGQVFRVSADGTSLVNLTEAISVTTVTAATATTNGVYIVQNTTFFANGTVFRQPLPTSSSGSSDDSVVGGSVMLIIIIVVVALAVVVVLVVVFKKKGSDSGAATSGGGTAFENPMYDETNTDDLGDANAQTNEGLYGDADQGYMDVPVAENENMYEDAPEEGADETGGYMDVDANDDADDADEADF